MPKFALGILIIVLTFVLTGAFFQRHALACELLPMLNYQQIDNDVFLGFDISSERAESIRVLITSASERIDLVYGAPVSKPRMLVTSDSKLAARWGANATASMHRTPWRSCIVIGPNGQNTDVIAHEWLHAEIQQRVGFFRFLSEIPVWFDEGAALTLDYRAPFQADNIDLTDSEIQSVRRLVRGRDFFSGDIRSNYQAARLTIEPLIITEHFFDNLEQVSLGESFESVFLANKSIQPTANAAAD